MDTGVRADHIAHLPDFKPESGILKWFLHLAPPEKAEISTFFVRGTVGMDLCEFGELVRRARNFCLIIFEYGDGLLLRSSDVLLRDI